MCFAFPYVLLVFCYILYENLKPFTSAKIKVIGEYFFTALCDLKFVLIEVQLDK